MMRRLAMLVSMIVALGLMAGAQALAGSGAKAASSPVITVDGQSPGRTFDGIGGLSAGASSALLRDYPARQRSQILDYLFKPDYGASLQTLKVEIGGDMNSTDGAEPSHERAQGQVDCDRGYEWWLMGQAKERNPDIKFYALEWGTPAWVGAGANTVWTSQNISYLLDWLGCARQHGMSISYLGGWNETGYNAAWFEQLRQALDSNGYSGIQIAADDSFHWSVAGAMASDPRFNSAVGVVTNHDPCSGIGGSQPSCPSTATAQGLGKPLWNSEQGAQVYNTDAGKLAQELNLGYIDGKMTSLITWSLIWSAYSSLPLQGTGLMLANTPWSGNYTVDDTMVWAMAHTAQFAQPGWRYLDSGSQRLPGGGSVVSLRAPGTDGWSSIAETVGATAPQPVTYQVQGGLSTGTVHVWATNLNSANPGDWFQHVADVQPHSGSFGLTLQPGYIYSLTTTAGQGKGTAQPPAASPWKLPYTESFDGYQAGVTPRLFSDVGGSFDTAPCDGRPGMCLQQEVTAQPVTWNAIDDYPLTVVGDPASWRNYQVSVDAELQQPGYVELDGRNPPTQGRSAGFFSSPPGYHFRIDDKGDWTLYKQDVAASKTTLASGTAGFGVGAWHRLGLRMRGDEITATLDGKPLATVLDSTYQAGQVGMEVSPWDRAQFDNLAVEPSPAAGQGPQLGAVQPDPVELSAAGSPAQVSTTVANPGSIPATAIDAELVPPAGWTATRATAPPAQLPAGQSAPLSWQLTAPASAAPGRYQATVTVTYTEGGLRWITSSGVPVDLGIIPQGQMSATATSSQPGYDAALAIDGDTSTFWHTEYSPVKAVPPQSITLDLGGTYNVSGLSYLPRQDGILNGTITAYNVYASADGTTFAKVGSGTWSDDDSQKSASFTPVSARYIRLEGIQAHNSNVSAAEINIFAAPTT